MFHDELTIDKRYCTFVPLIARHSLIIQRDALLCEERNGVHCVGGKVMAETFSSFCLINQVYNVQLALRTPSSWTKT